MTRAEMLERMSSRELIGWMAYHQVEPFGGETPYIGHAITASTIANVNRQKGTKAYKAEAFMPKWEKQEQGADEMISIAAMYTVGLGGQDLRGDDDG
jgi:hypothetical protein